MDAVAAGATAPSCHLICRKCAASLTPHERINELLLLLTVKAGS